ncbi:sensor histidine kinase [Halarcobacter ebronensis]|uniref:histidine kinase n=1 Tax=Halarcobacter ebronensis TaxID=1462615 RepID=A0A4Q1AU01_9BACT|nr:HAMP domain-containing sensor histidine kinase [Halarcobacter ebronensis]QKF81168.1 two-component system sensor histidine kinase [Halarcobacter ebronensis]RXK03257.1 hypothetical protein CRV07_12765 [Halarcobacter ebronensis]
MKLDLFAKIFIIVFIFLSSILGVFIYQLKVSQNTFLIKNLENKAKSFGEILTLLNSNNIIEEDEVKIFESLFGFVSTNSDVMSVFLQKKDGNSFLIKKESWKVINDTFENKSFFTGIVKSELSNLQVYRYVYSVELTGIKWADLIFELSLDEYNLQLKEINQQILNLIVVMFLGIFFISFLLAKVVSKPIIKLSHTSKLVSQGDLSQRVKIDSKDEIGELAKSFNEMISSLELSQKRLTNYKIDLENKVEERTKELKELNDNLEDRVIAEIKKREEQQQLLIQQSKLAAMGEMIGNIAHQWRQPLNALSLVVQNLKFSFDLGEVDDKQMNKSIQKINLLTKNMSKTIDDFRNFFKPNKEKLKFNIYESVNNALHLVDASFENHNIVVEKIIDENINVFGYPNEFLQSLLNLLNNSKDAFIENKINNGKIVIETKNDFKHVYIYIKDNAGGIAKEIENKIFEPYFTTKSESKGTGIGLYMAKTIIEQNMDGSLTNINSDNEAIFIIKLPIYKD